MTTPAEEHGTYAGAQRHRKADERPCEPCRLAERRYRRAYRQRGRCAPGLGWPLGPGDIAPAKPSEIAISDRHEAWAQRRAGVAS